MQRTFEDLRFKIDHCNGIMAEIDDLIVSGHGIAAIP